MHMTIFEKSPYAEKLDIGPTASKPGPMLLKVAITAEKLVVMENSFGSMDTSRKLTITMNTYSAR